SSGKKKTTFAAHAQGGFYVQFSNDGKSLATAGGTGQGPGGEIKLSEVSSGREITVFPHPSNVWSVQFSPDGRTLAVACWDSTVKLWELATRKQRAVFGLAPTGPPAVAATRAATPEQLKSCWEDMGGPDAVRAC